MDEVSEQLKESGLVHDGQSVMHPRLDECVKRHLSTRWNQPLHRPSLGAYRHFRASCGVRPGEPFILDSGCGTGSSSLQLAEMFPSLPVIGIDRSKHRLSRSGAGNALVQRGNCILIRAELATFWRLLADDGYTPARHYLLYPNPWPKSRHLRRRWHGHPVFPCLLSLGRHIEMRCNWKIYAMEFARAATLVCGRTVRVERLEPEQPLSPFERKYLERGQVLYSVNIPAAFTEGLDSEIRRIRER